jgi:hypothetical protein
MSYHFLLFDVEGDVDMIPFDLVRIAALFVHFAPHAN